MDTEIESAQANLTPEQMKNMLMILLAKTNINTNDVNNICDKVGSWNQDNNQLSMIPLRERIDLLFSEIEIIKVTHVLHENDLKDSLIGNVLVHNDSQQSYCILPAKYYKYEMIEVHAEAPNNTVKDTNNDSIDHDNFIGWKFINDTWYKLLLVDAESNQLSMVRFSSKWNDVNIKFENRNYFITQGNKFVVITKNLTTIIPVYSKIKLDILYPYNYEELMLHVYGEDINEVYEKMLLKVFEQLNINLTEAHYNIINKGILIDVIDVVLAFDIDYLQSSIVIGEHNLYSCDRTNDINKLLKLCDTHKQLARLKHFKMLEMNLLASDDISKIYQYYQIQHANDNTDTIEEINTIAKEFNIINKNVWIVINQMNKIYQDKMKEKKTNSTCLNNNTSTNIQMVDFWHMIINMKDYNTEPNANVIKNIIKNTSYVNCGAKLTDYIMHLWRNMNVTKPNVINFPDKQNMVNKHNIWNYISNNISSLKNPYIVKVFNMIKQNPDCKQEMIINFKEILQAINNKDKSTSIYLITIFIKKILSLKYKININQKVDLHSIIEKLQSSSVDNGINENSFDNSTYALLALINYFENIEDIQPDLHMKILCKALLMSAGSIGLMNLEDVDVLDILKPQIQYLLLKKAQSQQVYCSNNHHIYLEVLNLKVDLPNDNYKILNSKQFRVNNDGTTYGMLQLNDDAKTLVNLYGNCIITQPDSIYDIDPFNIFKYEYNPITKKLKVPNVNNKHICVNIDSYIIQNQFTHIHTIDGVMLKMTYSNKELERIYKLQDKILNIRRKFIGASEDNHIQLLQNKYNIRQRPM